LSQSHIDKILDLQEWRKHSQGLLIGYAGSARFVDTAFQALANVAIDPTLNVKLLLFGNVLPSHQKFFETKSVKFPFVEYEEYVQIMRFIKPDILVAPLEKNRTSMSKCPNKYLEYAIIGSAGIYSDVYPYSEFITHRSNGLLVPPDASVSEWTNAIVELIRDNNLRTKISSTARLDVMNNYETRKVLPLFLDVIQQVADCRTL
ncbi:MAG: glycosyltransferase, partial [Bacteroidia bacterium]|nr:glycosyltransferase [Bacteroidia bacterium]